MPVHLNTSGSIVVSDDSDTTDTDYEPETKKCKVVVEEETAESKGIGGSSGSGDCNKLEDVIAQSQGSSEGTGESSLTGSNSTDSRNSAPSQPCSVAEHLSALLESRSRNRLSEHSQRERLGEEEEDDREDEENGLNEQHDNDGSGSPSPTSVSVSSGSGGYLTDPVASDEIPSDLEYSPLSPSTPPPPQPLPPPQIQRHNRQRRNAIFERRDPPPATPQQIEDAEFYYNELEVASVSDINENPIEDVNSTSGTEASLSNEFHDSVSGSLNITVQASPDHSHSDDNNFADSEAIKSDIDSDATHNSSVRSKGLNSSDSEISEKDKWFCSQCHAKTPPYFRYCLRCFKVRRNWLPKRPPSRRLKLRKAAERRRSNVANTSKTTITSASSEGEDVVDGRPRGAVGNSQTQTEQSSSLEPNHELRTSPSSEVQPVLPSVPQIDLNEGFLVDDDNPSVNRLNSNTRPGNATLLELFSPPQSQSESQVLQAEGSQPLNHSEEATTDVDSSPPLTVSSSQSASTQSQSTTTSSSSSQSQSQASQYSQTSSQSQSSADFFSPPHPKLRSGATKTTAGQSVCNICLARAKDAAFVHNRVAHQYCCYPCADKILKRDGKCPICRERVLRVVKVIVVLYDDAPELKK